MTDDLVERCKGHTPGPWSILKRSDEVHIIGRPTWGCEYFGKKGRWSVALLDETIADENPREARANAHLIAAAPDLLDRIEALEAENERLREALGAYTEYCDICHGRGSIIEEDAITGAELWRDCPGCGPARAALKETGQ